MLDLQARRRIVRAASLTPIIAAPVLLPFLRGIEPVFQWIVDRYDGQTYIAGIPVLHLPSRRRLVPSRRQLRRYLVRSYGVTSVWGLFVNLMKMVAIGALVYLTIIVLLAGGG